MGIRVEHGKPSTLLTAAQISGEVRAAQRQAELSARIQEQQLDMDYRVNLKQQDIALDLEMQQRAKLWEVEKMQLRSQIDFQREEQKRQRELDTYDNIETQIKKEVQSGRMSEEEAEPFLFSNNLNRQGANISPSQVKQLQQEDEDRYGVRPYYLEPEFERDYPELAEAKRKETISGVRRGTIPYYLDPEWLRANRDIAMQVLESRGVMLEEDEIDAWIEREKGEEVLVMSPTGEEGTIPAGDLDEALAEGYTIIKGGNTGFPLADKELDIGVRKPSLLTPRHSPAGRKYRIGEAARGSSLYRVGK